MRTQDKVLIAIIPAGLAMIPIALCIGYAIIADPRIGAAWLKWLLNGEYHVYYFSYLCAAMIPMFYGLYVMLRYDWRVERTARLEARIYGYKRPNMVPFSTIHVAGMVLGMIAVSVSIVLGY